MPHTAHTATTLPYRCRYTPHHSPTTPLPTAPRTAPTPGPCTTYHHPITITYHCSVDDRVPFVPNVRAVAFPTQLPSCHTLPTTTGCITCHRTHCRATFHGLPHHCHAHFTFGFHAYAPGCRTPVRASPARRRYARLPLLRGLRLPPYRAHTVRCHIFFAAYPRCHLPPPARPTQHTGKHVRRFCALQHARCNP